MPGTADPAGRTRVRPVGGAGAAWTLVFLTTACAELTFSAVAIPLTWILLPLLLAMYGAGVLLLREAAVRVGARWPSLVLLGLAYELVEDGIGLQALTSPSMYGSADGSWRALGLNLAYWVSQIGVHVVLSVLLPIMLADLLFPARRGRPYLGVTGLVVVAVTAVLGVLGLRFLISATQDPGYRTPWGWTAAFVVAIVALVVVALRVLPRSAPPRPGPVTAPPPVTVALLAGVATLAFLALLMPPGLGPATLLDGVVPDPVTTVLAAAIGIAAGWQVVRWSGAANWSDQHRILLAGGVLVAHTLFMMPASAVSAVLGTVTVVVEVVALVLLYRLVETRSTAGAGPG